MGDQARDDGRSAGGFSRPFLFTDYAPYPKASQLIEIYFGCRYFIPNSPLNGNIAEFCDPRLDAQI